MDVGAVMPSAPIEASARESTRAPALSATELARRSAEIGAGSIALAGRAFAALVRQVPYHVPEPVASLARTPDRQRVVQGVERVGAAVSVLVADALHLAADRIAPHLPGERMVGTVRETIRREQDRSREAAGAFLPLLVQQVAEAVVSQIDMARLARMIPVEDIVAEIDVEAVVARLDLGGIVRESTMGLSGELLDALRWQGVGLDGLVARSVDRVLFRRGGRDLTAVEALPSS